MSAPALAMETCLTHQFLLAMPGLTGDFFANTITYICEHNDDGALGLMINRPMDLTIAGLLEHLEIDHEQATDVDRQVLVGGPVQTEHGLILYRNDSDHADGSEVSPSRPLSQGLMLSSTRETLESIGAGTGPEHFLMLLGHAGWGPGQLESEIADNAWLTCPASMDVLFHVPFEQRVDKAAASLGIDFRLMSSHAGHA